MLACGEEVLKALFASNLSIRNRQKDDDDIDTCRDTIWALFVCLGVVAEPGYFDVLGSSGHNLRHFS
jgi:hypothetical protein